MPPGGGVARSPKNVGKKGKKYAQLVGRPTGGGVHRGAEKGGICLVTICRGRNKCLGLDRAKSGLFD